MDPQGPEARLDELTREVRELRGRIAELERRMEGLPAQALPMAETAATAASQGRGLEQTASALPILGRGLLALAGAYLLRALTSTARFRKRLESQPGSPMRRCGWCWRRAPGGGAVGGCDPRADGALVLGPLLFETTVQLKAVRPGTAAAAGAVLDVRAGGVGERTWLAWRGSRRWPGSAPRWR
jgi:hypothetical protein